MKNYTINLDWLELVLLPITEFSTENKTGFCFSSTGIPDSILGFKKYIKIKYNNQAFCTLYFEPTSRLRFENNKTIVLRMENEELYREGSIKTELKLFLSTYGLRLKNIRNMHIAIDGPNLIKYHNELFNKKKELKRKISLMYTINGKDSNLNEPSITLGSRKSDKFIRFYNKTKEINFSGKKYIIDFWRNNNLNMESGDIDRMELVLKSDEFKNMTIDIELLESPNYLATLFNLKVKDYLTFIDIKSKEQIELLDWKAFQLMTIKKEKMLLFRKPTQRIKSTIKTLFLEGIEKNLDYDIERAKKLAIDYNLLAWYQNIQSRWLKENTLFL
jgi:hypothetical protein